MAGEELARPWIGVYYVPISPALAEAEGLPVDYGALIGTDGRPGGGLPRQPGRGGRPRRTATSSPRSTVSRSAAGADLSMLILPHAPGDTITLSVLRDNSTQRGRRDPR